MWRDRGQQYNMRRQGVVGRRSITGLVRGTLKETTRVLKGQRYCKIQDAAFSLQHQRKQSIPAMHPCRGIQEEVHSTDVMKRTHDQGQLSGLASPGDRLRTRLTL